MTALTSGNLSIEKANQAAGHVIALAHMSELRLEDLRFQYGVTAAEPEAPRVKRMVSNPW